MKRFDCWFCFIWFIFRPRYYGYYSDQDSDFHTSQVKWRNHCLQTMYSCIKLYSSFTCDEHCWFGNIFCSWEYFIHFCIFSLIQVWFLSSRRKEASIWKSRPSLVWREDRTISLQGLFSDRECLVMCAFKCNQRRAESWSWFHKTFIWESFSTWNSTW